MRKTRNSTTLGVLWFAILLFCVGVRATCARAKHPPTKSVCGVLGKLADSTKDVFYQTPSVTDTRNECVNQCFAHGFKGPCHAFSFNSTSKICQYLSHLHLNDIKRDKSSDTIFFNENCFDCTAKKCSRRKGPNGHGNEIANGGFEDSDTYVGPWTGDDFYNIYVTFHPKKPGINSSQAFHCNDDGISQSYQSCPGQTHRIDFDATKIVAAPLDRITLGFGDVGGVEWRPTTGETGKKSQQESFFYKAQKNRGIADISCTVFDYMQMDSSMTVDNFRIRPVDMFTLKVLDEKVINGDFETGRVKPTVIRRPSNNRFSIVSPGLKGSKFALQDKGFGEFDGIFITPKINETALGKGRRLYRLSVDTDFDQAILIYQLGRIYKRGAPFRRETMVFGKAKDFGYFYADKDDFPLWINLLRKSEKNITLTIDNISVRELQEE